MYAREKDFPSKQECNAKENKNTLASTSSRWTGIKDPRIVRVSRTFGGKDRHSKVCTVKGLRDRRVRLSMPTAIQLYDLQDRLGLNQPSKVVDWLLNAARLEIDKLPPLQMPPGNFGQFLQSMVVSQEVSATKTSLVSLVGANMEYGKVDGAHSLLSNKGGIKINNNVDGEEQTIVPKSTYWNLESRTKHKEVERETIAGKNNWIKRNEEEYQEGIEAGHSTQVPPQNSFPKANHSSEAGLLNSVMPHNSYCHLEPSNLSLSHLGSQGYSYQTEDPHNYNVVPLPSSLSLPSGSQILLCPSGTTPSFFPPYVTTPVDCGTRQINHFQMLSPSSQNLLPNSLTPSLYSINPPMRPFQLSITPKLLYPQNDNGIQSNRDDDGPLSTPTGSFFQNDPKAT